MTLLKFEWKKWRKNSKNRVILLLVLLSTMSFSSFKNYEHNKESEKYIAESSMIYKNLNDTLIQLQESDITEVTKQQIPLYQQAIEGLNEEYIGISNGEWQRAIKGSITYQEAISQLIDLGMTPPTNVNESKITETIKQDNYLLKHKIQPIRYQAKLSAMNSTQLFFENGSGLVFLLLFIFLFFDCLCSEYEYTNMNLLFTQPYKRSRFIQTKIQLAVLSVIVMIPVLTAINFFISWFLSKDIGNLTYPIVFDRSSILFLWQYLLMMFLFAIIWSIIVLFFMVSLSLTTKSSLLVLILTTICFALPTVALDVLKIQATFVEYIPFYYLSNLNVTYLSEPLKIFAKGMIVLVVVAFFLGLIVKKTIKDKITMNENKT
ncbi:hypothetical protein ACYSNW_13080 [Enterococcus sp. LJL99]